MADPILVAKHGDIECFLLPALANRHGLITGATGTGKTITLQTLAENLLAHRRAGLHGRREGRPDRHHASTARCPTRWQKILDERGLAAPTPTKCPTTLWDVFGEQGHPVRATVSDMGPLLLARMLALNETQAGVLQPGVQDRRRQRPGAARPEGPARDAAARGRQRRASSPPSTATSARPVVGAIQRGLLQIDEQGGDKFFGEPMLDIADFMQTDRAARASINILAADKLMNAPRLYATFLLWMLSELFETLPEVGDLDKPKLVFFFDEAHLLFNDAPKALVERIELVVRLVRSKGVGVYFVTQNPLDIPDTVLGQLGNRVQHALRAFTPRDQKAVQAAAEHDARQSEGRRHRRRDHRARVSARRWSAFSTRRAARASPSACSCCRRAARSGRSRPSSARR